MTVDKMTFDEAQDIHEKRVLADATHDRSPCVCCCMDCDDLVFGP